MSGLDHIEQLAKRLEDAEGFDHGATQVIHGFRADDYTLDDAASALRMLKTRVERYESEKDPYAPHNKQQLDEMAAFINEQATTIRSLRGALGELHAMVWGECSSLLNEDSGGDADLDLLIRSLIQGHTQ